MIKCEHDKILVTKEIYNESLMCMSHDEKVSKILNDGTYKETIAIVLDDRGYLRLCSVDDMQCLDHGEKYKINFCPICGDKLVR